MDLVHIWLNDAENPSDKIALTFVGDSYRITPRIGGGVDDGYASGRSRTYTTEGEFITITLGMQWMTDEQISWILDHRGRVLCFRDHTGWKVFCAFHEPGFEISTRVVADHTGALTLKSVSFDEAV